MRLSNPLTQYPKSFNQVFIPLLAGTGLVIGYLSIWHFADLKASAGAFLKSLATNPFGVILALTLATGFGRVPLRRLPVMLYGLATVAVMLALLLNLQGMPLEGKLTPTAANLGFFVAMLALPLPFLAWGYLFNQRPGIYGVLGGAFGMVVGTTAGSLAFSFAGLGLLSSHVLLARNTKTVPRLKAHATHESGDNGKADLKQHPAQKPRFTFADVDGMTELKETLLKAAGEASSKQQGSRNGILLYGPPGNGKSFIAEALAGELGLGIVHISFGSLSSRWVNQTTEAMVALFAEVAKHGKVVLFLDEIDALLVDRSKIHNADSESAKTVSTFLAEVDKLRRYPVILIGATNHIDRLDPAAIREGRFDIKVEMTPPDLDARLGIFERFLMKSHRFTLNAETRSTLRDILGRMDGFSVSRIRALAEEYARRHKDSGAEIGYHTILSSLRAIQGKSASEQERFPALSDLVLAPSTEERLQTLVALMKNPLDFEELGGKVPRGVLLYGPPGTGKTTLAKAIAKESGWTFTQTSGHKLLHDPDEVRSVLDRGRDLKPAIIFIDEADDILQERGYSGNAALTNELLTAMDGNSYGLTDVMFIAATNHPDALDSAAVRGGRLGFHIEVGLPGPAESRRLAESWFRRKGIDFKAEGFDLNDFLLPREGVSPADLLHDLDEWANARAARVLRERGGA